MQSIKFKKFKPYFIEAVERSGRRNMLAKNEQLSNTKIIIFLYVTPCSFVDKCQRLGVSVDSGIQPNGGNRFLRNFGTYLRNYTSLFP
jgi:hypothetical protein